MSRSWTGFLSALALATVCGCHGEGAKEGEGAQEEPLTVAPASLAYTRVAGARVFDFMSDGILSATWAAYASYATTVIAAEPAPWLVVSSGSGWSSGPESVGVHLRPDLTTVGSHTAAVRFTISRGDRSEIAHRDVPVTLEVLPFGVDPPGHSNYYLFGSSRFAGSSQFDVLAVTSTAWTASADAPWILLGATTGVAPGNVSVGTDVSGMGVGTHGGAVTFVGGTHPFTLPITVEVAPPRASISGGTLPSPIGCRGDSCPPIGLVELTGRASAPKQLRAHVDTGTNAYPFELSASDWVDVVQTLSTASESGTPFTVSPSAAATRWPDGVYEGTITVVVNVKGLLVRGTVPVRYVPGP